MNIKIHKSFGKHDKIGTWFAFSILPSIVIAKSCDFIKYVPVYSIGISWLFWNIQIS